MKRWVGEVHIPSPVGFKRGGRPKGRSSVVSGGSAPAGRQVSGHPALCRKNVVGTWGGVFWWLGTACNALSFFSSSHARKKEGGRNGNDLEPQNPAPYVPARFLRYFKSLQDKNQRPSPQNLLVFLRFPVFSVLLLAPCLILYCLSFFLFLLCSSFLFRELRGAREGGRGIKRGGGGGARGGGGGRGSGAGGGGGAALAACEQLMRLIVTLPGYTRADICSNPSPLSLVFFGLLRFWKIRKKPAASIR